MTVDPGLGEEVEAFFVEPREILFPRRLIRPAGAVIAADDDIFGERIEFGSHAGEMSLAVERPLRDHQPPAVLLDRLVQLEDVTEHEVGDLIEREAAGLEAVDVDLGDVYIEQFAGECPAQLVNHRCDHLDGVGLPDVERHDPGHFFGRADPQMLVLGLAENVE